MRRLLFVSIVFVLSCKALPVRIDSPGKSSTHPELEAVPEQNFEDYARSQTEAWMDAPAENESPPSDPYEIYQNGGREFIRQLFRALRDQPFESFQWPAYDEEKLRTWAGIHCKSVSMDQLIRSALPVPQVMATFPLFGWEVSTLSDPMWVHQLHDQLEGMDTPLDDEHRLLLFESGIRVRGTYQKTTAHQHIELTYKVVHEHGEPLSWLKRDGWGTRITIDLRLQDSQHQRLRITRELGPELYENGAADGSHAELLMSWNEEGPQSQFHLQIMAAEEEQAFTLMLDRQQQTIEVRWQKERAAPPASFKLHKTTAGFCRDVADGA